MKYILGSGSPRRKELFEKLGLDFTLKVMELDENSVEVFGDPAATVENVALLKMEAVEKDILAGDKIIVTADTVVYADKILGKPADEEEAVEMLNMLSGRYHDVYTGVAVRAGNKTEVFHEVSRVKFMNLDKKEINAYVKRGEYKDKAGAYAIQGLGAFFIERIEGDYYNVVGFPVNRFIKVLRDKFDMDVFLNE